MSGAQNAVEQPALNHIITSADELTQRIAEWKGKGYHVLSPAHQMTAFPPCYGVIATAMFIDTRPEAKECYSDGTLVRSSDRAFTRTGIKKIEQLAGISWLPTASRRTDPRSQQFLWEYESWCGLLGYDGQPRTQKGTAEIDLRDGSPQIGGWTKADWLAAVEKDKEKAKINGWSEKRVMQARQFGLRLAEAKSESAAVRAALGLRSAYPADELKHPFIVLKVTYLPDYTDASVRHLIADRATQGIATMYAGVGNVVQMPAMRELPPMQPSAVDELETLAMPERDEEPVPVKTQTGPTIPPVVAPPVPAPQPEVPRSQAPQPTREQIKDAVDQSQERANAPKPAATPAPLPANTVYVTNYRDEKKPKRNGGFFTKGYAELSDGREVVTVYGPFRDRLQEARNAKTPLLVDDKPSDYVPHDGSDPEREVKAIQDARAPQDVPLPIDPSAPVRM